MISYRDKDLLEVLETDKKKITPKYHALSHAIYIPKLLHLDCICRYFDSSLYSSMPLSSSNLKLLKDVLQIAAMFLISS
jgi:hypothetical protein